MEDMAAIVPKLGKKPRLDHYETVDDEDSLYEKAYESDDVSSVDSWDSDYETKKIKRETNKKFEVWSATIKPEDVHTLFDTTGACILEMDGHKLMSTNLCLFHDLTSLLKSCIRRMIIYTFTHPGESGSGLDGGGTSAHESSELSDLELQSYSTKARNVIQQYNHTVTNKHSNSNSNSELEFASLTRVTYIFPSHLFITFTARQTGNGQIGTYEAALSDDFYDDQVHLVLLRHVESDKILAIMSISGAEEELKKMYGENWNH